MNKNIINIGIPSKGRLRKDILKIFKMSFDSKRYWRCVVHENKQWQPLATKPPGSPPRRGGRNYESEELINPSLTKGRWLGIQSFSFSFFIFFSFFARDASKGIQKRRNSKEITKL